MVLGFNKSSHSHAWTPGSFPAGPMFYTGAAPVYPATVNPYLYSPQPMPLSPIIVPVSIPHVHVTPVNVIQQQPQPPPASVIQLSPPAPANTYTVIQCSPAPAPAPPLPPAEHHHHYYHVPSPVISHTIPPAASPRPSRSPLQFTPEFENDSRQSGCGYGGRGDNNALRLQVQPAAAVGGQQQQQAQAFPFNLIMVMPPTPQQQQQQQQQQSVVPRLHRLCAFFSRINKRLQIARRTKHKFRPLQATSVTTWYTPPPSNDYSISAPKWAAVGAYRLRSAA